MMQVAYDFDELQLAAPVLLTIGTFDGVHRGHRYLLEQAEQRAVEHGYGLVIVTFDPCPAVVLRPSIGRYQLTTGAQKLRLLQEVDPAVVLMLHFTRDLSQLTANEFMDALEARVSLRELWLGEDFRFGRDRAGGLPMLVERGRESGFSLHVVARRMEDRASISSTRVREALAAGDVEGAIPLLGYPFARDLTDGKDGEWVDGTGHAQCFTVPSELALPAEGIYAALCTTIEATSVPIVVAVHPDAPQDQIRISPPAARPDQCTVEFISRMGSVTTGDLGTAYTRARALLAEWQRPAHPPAGSY